MKNEIISFEVFKPIEDYDHYDVDFTNEYADLIAKDFYSQFNAIDIVEYILDRMDWVTDGEVNHKDPMRTVIECSKYPSIQCYDLYEYLNC